MEIGGSPLGFVSIPRSGLVFRPTGDFFSATVVSKQGPHSWTLFVGGHSLTVTSTLEFRPGEILRLKLDPGHAGRWIVQNGSLPEAGPARMLSPLAAAFVGQGLPLVQERLTQWQKWLDKLSGPHDKERWAASLDSRGQRPWEPLSEALQPWLSWQQALERGENPPPPDEEFWDLWNTRTTASGDPWLVQVVRWEYHGRSDAGLLQAHFHPQRQSVDAWTLTAAPNAVPLRIQASIQKNRLDLALQFFRPSDLANWNSQQKDWNSLLSREDFSVAFKAGLPEPQSWLSKEGVNVVI